MLPENNWASAASPTLECSIEISGDMSVYVGVCLHVVCQINCIGGITWPTRMLSLFWAVKPVTSVLFISYMLEL